MLHYRIRSSATTQAQSLGNLFKIDLTVVLVRLLELSIGEWRHGHEGHTVARNWVLFAKKISTAAALSPVSKKIGRTENSTYSLVFVVVVVHSQFIAVKRQAINLANPLRCQFEIAAL